MLEKYIEILIWVSQSIDLITKKQRWIQMLRIAFGQSKMIDKPIVGILHHSCLYRFFSN